MTLYGLLLGVNLMEVIRSLGVGRTSAIAIVIAAPPLLYGRKVLGLGSILGSWLRTLMVSSLLIGALILSGVFPSINPEPIHAAISGLLELIPQSPIPLS